MTRLAVVGAGSMGAQIAQQAALHGIDAVLHDQGEDQLRKARASNQGHIARRVEKGRLSEETAREALERVRETTDLREAAREVFGSRPGAADLPGRPLPPPTTPGWPQR